MASVEVKHCLAFCRAVSIARLVLVVIFCVAFIGLEIK